MNSYRISNMNSYSTCNNHINNCSSSCNSNTNKMQQYMHC